MSWATSAREITTPRRRFLPVRSAVGAGQCLVGQPWRAYHGPVEAAVAKHVLHPGEIGIVLPEYRFDQRAEEVSHKESVAGVVSRRIRAAGRRHGRDRCRAHDDDASNPCRLHRLDDGPGALPGHTHIGSRNRTERGDHRVGASDRRLEHCRVWGGQVGFDDAYLPAQLLRISDDCRDVVTSGDGLVENLPTGAAGRGEYREPHPSLHP